MTGQLRRVDARFLLPEPGPIAAMGDAPGWSEGLAELDAAPASTEIAHAVVGDAANVAPALLDPTVTGVISLGRSPREHDHWRWSRVLVRPGPIGPRLLVPAGRPDVARYVFARWSIPPERWKRSRSRLVATALGRGVLPCAETISVGGRGELVPYLVRAAQVCGVPADPTWFCAFGDGDDLQRATFHVFESGAPDPGWIVKFARRAGDDGPFLAEERAWRLLSDRAPRSAERVSRFLGRCDVDVPASVESAVAGPALSAVLDASPGRSRATRLIDDAVEWIVELGLESRGRVDELDPELDRLARAILPAWPDAPRDLVARLPPIAPVLAHHDLGTWNMVATRRGIGVIDWESARFPALPLWDLLYFLTDALIAVDGPAPPEIKARRALALLRGEHDQSSRLFRELRRAADRFEIPTTAVPPLATLAWLHHGTSPDRRTVRAESVGGGAGVGIGLLSRLAGPWLRDPALGPDWAAFPR